MQILNKITMKSVCGELQGILEARQATDIDTMTIIGVVKGKEEVPGQYGISWRLKGEFKAKNMMTKEDFYSGSCFLPSLAEDLILGQMDPQGENALQFAFVIGIKAAKNKVGYEYSVKPLIKPSDNNALMLIEKQIQDFQAQEIK